MQIFPFRAVILPIGFTFLLTLSVTTTQAADCIDGQTCYCDRAVVKNDTATLHCEDFEAAALYEDIPGTWYQSPGGDNGYRGGDNLWTRTYGGTGAGNWHLGKPVNPKRGFPCAYNTCGAAEYHPTNLWDGNSEAAIDIQRQGDVALEVPGLTLDSQLHDLGKQWNAWRIGPGSTSGIMGLIRLSPAATEIGISYIGGYSSNLLSATGVSSSGDFVPHPWKHEEWGSQRSTIFQGNVGAGGAPFSPAIFSSSGLSVSACQTLLSAASITAGQVQCGDLSGSGSQAYLRIGSNFDRSTEWPLGTFACIRGHIQGLGSTTSGSMKIWFNDKLIFSIENANFQRLIYDQSFSSVEWNPYYNGNQGDPGSTPTTNAFYRYMDNVHIRRGPPAPCAQIGFNGGSGDAIAPAPPTGLQVQ